MHKVRKYLLGDFHQSQLAILVALFFAMSGLGFALIKQSHYAFAGLIIATLIYKFSYRFIQLYQPFLIVFFTCTYLLTRLLIAGKMTW